MADEDLRYFRSRLPDFVVTASPEPLKEPTTDAEILSVMVHSKVTASHMAKMPSLKLIATRSTGFDHIDVAAATERGITTCNVPTYGSNTVAEHTFALILTLSRKVHTAHVRCLHGDLSLTGLMGFDLVGKTLGVIGAGRIGLHVARIGKGFGMEVLACDPYADPMYAELLGFSLVGLDDLLCRSDVVALCCPLNESTRHLINRETLSKMKRGSVLVNTARGAVVDATDLLWALDEGILAGAGLDVLESEELLGEDALVASLVSGEGKTDTALLAENLVLMRHPNVIVTPHMAFYSAEAIRRILDTTAENIHAFSAGRPQNVV